MKQKRRRPAWRKICLITAALVALAAAWRYTPLAQFVTPERILAVAGRVRETVWAPIALVAAYTPAACVLFPRALLTLFAVVAFGAWLGAGYAGAGILAAALATYYAGRVIGYSRVRRIAGERLDPVSKVLREHGVMAIFALNQVPVPPFAVQGLIAGACRIPPWQYALGTVLGTAPALAAWGIFGDQLAAALEKRAGINWWILGAVLVVLTVFTYLVRRWFAKQHAWSMQ
jgi:uncharacterized membrane protein YdjX (TVP38/TMEM64 family)